MPKASSSGKNTIPFPDSPAQALLPHAFPHRRRPPETDRGPGAIVRARRGRCSGQYAGIVVFEVPEHATARIILGFVEGLLRFALTRDEIRRMSQIVISPPDEVPLKFSKSVNVFTEHGVAMLSSVLNSPQIGFHAAPRGSSVSGARVAGRRPPGP